MSRLATIALLALAATAGARADESFDPSAYDKKAFEWTGFVEARPEVQRLSPGSAGYLLQYPGETRRSASRLGLAAEVSGVLRHQSLSFNFTGHASWVDDPKGTDIDSRMYEAYGGWQLNERLNIEAGKRALRWGKGYAWNPVAFLERPKDPTDPELAREGFVMATGTWVRSFEGPLQTLALTAAVVPTSSSLNTDFGGGAASADHANAALKLYGLVYDTDVDVIWSARGSRGPRLGIDFSRNVGSNLEIHGEWASIADATRATLTAGNVLQTEMRDHSSALIGARYLTERDTTIIFELYRNGGGYTSDELGDFYDLVRASASSPALSSLVSRAAAQGYSRPNAAQRYAYLRVSQKEPFDILDFTPSVSLIMNTHDRSWSLTPELLYTGFKNVELRARMALNRGDAGSEYGERAVGSRIELRARMFF
ncbi:MAG: hypothetical protein AB7S86_12065 [Hydrogenophaga sp.]|uniref:hypothetical protein n=1 Tax=Hydrogenophaga sp. TaxID=1904254 RepID=UPI003D1060F0